LAPEKDYLLALYTSPRKKGNTAILLDELAAGTAESGVEVVQFHTASMDIRPCRECNSCYKDGKCVQQDDMQLIYPHLAAARAVAIAAPIFSMNICAQAKALIDRCQCLWSARYVLKKKPVDPAFEAVRLGFFISCCGREAPATFECTMPTMAYFFYIIQVASWQSLTFAGVDEAGAILKVPGALEAALDLGKSLVNGSQAG
jgi:multimeric flavodoxin WrbA